MNLPSTTYLLADLGGAPPKRGRVNGSIPGQMGALSTSCQPDLQPVLRALEASLRAADYSGWDPFDGLNSRVFTALGLQRSALLRLAWIQLFKRSPVNFRNLALVPKTSNPKALALMSMGYGRTGDTRRQSKLIDRLLAMRLDVGAWGYPFDWQARAFYVPAGTPNVICTAYAVQALVAHQQNTGTGHGRALAEAARFIEKELIRKTGGLTYIAYIPKTDALVHNANLWGAYVLAAADQHTSRSQYRALVQAAVDCSIGAQADDGSWPYGNRHHHQFVDSFHTGFNLQALELLDDLLPDAGLGSVIDRGLRYYANTFFDEDGRPRYYADTPWPIDCHSAAQACLTLLGQRSTAEHQRLARNVLSWVVKNMWDNKRHVFHYQRHRFHTNAIDYMRWTQAWMFLAIAHVQSVSNAEKKNAAPCENPHVNPAEFTNIPSWTGANTSDQ